ncbi:MAG: hypothetical protein OXI15_03995 [Chromatiales bacterium]|nr:hypothetical protein [Chromatiales bacterium]
MKFDTGESAMPLEYVTIGIGIAILGFLWSLHRDMRMLSDRVSRVEGLLEGLRDAVTGHRQRIDDLSDAKRSRRP